MSIILLLLAGGAIVHTQWAALSISIMVEPVISADDDPDELILLDDIKSMCDVYANNKTDP